MNEETKDNSYNSAKTQHIPTVRLAGNGWKRIRKRLQGSEPFMVYYKPSSPNYPWIALFRSRFSQRIPYSVRKCWKTKQVSDFQILVERKKQ